MQRPPLPSLGRVLLRPFLGVVVSIVVIVLGLARLARFKQGGSFPDFHSMEPLLLLPFEPRRLLPPAGGNRDGLDLKFVLVVAALFFSALGGEGRRGWREGSGPSGSKR